MGPCEQKERQFLQKWFPCCADTNVCIWLALEPDPECLSLCSLEPEEEKHLSFKSTTVLCTAAIQYGSTFCVSMLREPVRAGVTIEFHKTKTRFLTEVRASCWRKAVKELLSDKLH